MKRKVKNKAKKTYVYDGTKAGRPKTKRLKPPSDFNWKAMLKQSELLDERGWLDELNKPPKAGTMEYERQEAEYIQGEPQRKKLLPFVRNRTVGELKKAFEFSCRLREKSSNMYEDIVGHIKGLGGCNSPDEAEWALSSGREVVYFDPRYPNVKLKALFAKHLTMIRARRAATKPDIKSWVKSRILAFHYLMRHGLLDQYTLPQIAAWIFPDIDDAQVRWKRIKNTQKVYQEAMLALAALQTDATTN